MKKYNISKKKCSRCGGLISWDDYPDPKWPIHIDEKGNKIGYGSCPQFKKNSTFQKNNKSSTFQTKYKNSKSKNFIIDKKLGYILFSVFFLSILIGFGIVLIIDTYQGGTDDQEETGDQGGTDDQEETGDQDGTGDQEETGDQDGTDNGNEQNWEVDREGTVTYIVDGDTYDIGSDRIRLADVDTPEKGESGYQAAKNHLNSLIYNKKVYLDIDDQYGTGYYGRIIAVTYVRYNSTHLQNVNKNLLIFGYAIVSDYDNEFNPYSWSLYVYYV